MSMDILRTFIAIELPAEIHDALAAAISALRTTDTVAARSVKWVDSRSIHLTLKFLGDTPASSLEAIGCALAAAANTSHVLPLCLGRAGCFPSVRQPRVLWVGVSGDLEDLTKLQAAVERSVSPLGFPGEARPFAPHLTLGRVRDDAPTDVRQRMGAAVQALRLPALRFRAASISLMRSELRPGGAVYTRLAEAILPAGAQTT
jgi:2'-5' RNA ligase